MSSVGQLVITGISGPALTNEEKKFIEDEDIGGVILFQNNYESPAQLAELINSIQVLRKEYPLFICTDHEGGRVMRFKTGFTFPPPMLEIAKLNSPKIVFELAVIMAQELKAVGVNLNLSPVCDIWSNEQNKVIWDRSFGKDHDTVSKFVSAMIRGYETEGILSCAKHFPGHGDTLKDSHFDLPIIKKSLQEIRENEFQPFIKAIKARVDFVMMAHLIVDDIDCDFPTSLSSKAHDILRKELKFKGIIISDDMVMKAITDNFGLEESAVMAIHAGSDIVEYRTMEAAMAGLNGLKAGLKNKQLKQSEIQEKILRITEKKKNHFSEYRPIYIPDLEKKVNTRKSQVFIEDLKKRISQMSAQTARKNS